MDRTQCESEERLGATLPASLPVGGSSGECHTVARDNVP